MVCMLPSVSAVSPVGKREALLVELEEEMEDDDASSRDVACWVLVGQQRWPPSSSQGRLSEVVVTAEGSRCFSSVRALFLKSKSKRPQNLTPAISFLTFFLLFFFIAVN